jgi:RHS repeat-associated protein
VWAEARGNGGRALRVHVAAARSSWVHQFTPFLLTCALIATSVPLAPTFEAAAAAGDPFRFIYDQIGRLVAAVTPTDTAIYAYDAVGNMTTITRQAATTLAVIEFAPHAGAVGNSVTIYGTAFSTTPSLNTVKFNGTTATVVSSTTTQIVTSVPAGATSGTISVKVGNTTKTSSASFTVGSTAPTITGFSPGVVNPTGTVTVSGTNFETAGLSDDLTFGGTFATITGTPTATSLTASVPPMSASGRVVVRTPNGKSTAANDLFIAPLSYSATQIGPTGRVALGQSQTLTFAGDGKIGLLLFDGVVGHRITATLARTGGTGYDLTILGPDRNPVYPTTCCSQSLVDAITLPLTGTYQFVLDPFASAAGTVTITAYDVPPDPTQPITPTNAGTTATLSTTVPGQNMAFTFGATAGQRVTFSLTPSAGLGWATTVYKPSGGVLWGTACCGNTWVELLDLQETGTYKIFLDPVNTLTGSLTITAYDVPPDPTTSLTIDGPSATLGNTVPGQNMAFTFSGTSGQNLNITLSPSGLSSWSTTVYNPSGSVLWGTACCGNTSLSVSLVQSGVHKILIDPVTTAVGSITATVATGGGFAPAPGSPSGTATLESTIQAPAVEPGVAVAAAAQPSATPTATPSPTHRPAAPVRATTFTQPTAPEQWVPDVSARQNWRSGNADSAWRSLAGLQAEQGVTALSGQVLALNGKPLEGIEVEIGEAATRTDANGQFLLVDLPAGHVELMVDGGVSREGASAPHGIFCIGIEILAGETNRLPFTVWLPQLDTAHTVQISSPTTGEVVLTTPHIPGLEVHIPAGTTIIGEDGEPVTALSITAIPIDRPPFPLPALQEIPVYFTIQPGGAYLSQKARIIYPNYTNLPAGTRANFWHYDPEGRGWYIYGQGTVTEDGKQVVPDPGIGIYELTGAMFGGGLTPAAIWAALGNFFSGGDPVDLGTGLFILDKTDLALPDVMPLTLSRTYRQNDPISRPFGKGTSHPYAVYLWSATPSEYQQVELILPDGGRVHYVRISPGTEYFNAVFEHTATPTRFYGSRIAWNGTGWDLTLKDGTKLVFVDSGPLKYIADRFGNRTTFERPTSGPPNIKTIRSPNGRWIAFTYDTDNRITQAKDNGGRTVGYQYNAAGYLWKVTDTAGKVTEYGYDASDRLRTIKDPRNITWLTVDYDANGRVWKQTQADGTFFQFAYTLDGNGKVMQTDLTDPRTFVRRSTFNSAGYGTSDIAAFGQAIAQTTSYELDPVSYRVLSVTDPLGRVTLNTYYPSGDLETTTNLYGTPDAVTTTFTYEPVFGDLASVEDPLHHITTFGYLSGNRVSETDALQHATAFDHNPAGQLISTTNALQKTTLFAYEGADLASITDPLGRVTKRFSDALGRPLIVTDPLGNRTSTTYDALNRVMQVTDARGGVTQFTYDDNGNRLTVKDAKLNTTTYTYNNLDQVATRKDALLRIESYTYDSNGNLVTVTDRKNQVTEFRYDALDRRTFAGFARTGSPPNYTYQSTIDYIFDAANRLHIATDSASGTITREFDGLDRMWSETTGQGVATYQFDSAGRRTQLQVAGQPAVFYCYDNADRLLALNSSATCAQGSNLVAFGYDNADRRTLLTLAGMLTVDYGYDDASQLLALTYKRAGSTIGDLAYTYDASGRRATTSGSYARLGLPAAVSTTIYNANNQLTKWGTTTISYDNNGNMLGDGVNTYSWNARDQLSAVTKSGQTLPSFTYDAFGRRQKKTLGATVTSYLYDGANAVQELIGVAPSANLLTGLGVDEVFQRSETGATRTLLSDALGSTLALADATGVPTSYTYAPYGATTFTGSASNNTSQFTGRENDSDGLYYYRARYYHLTFSRFVSEDPIGFGGGDPNIYSYAIGNPVSFTDPSGMILPWIGACLGGAAFSSVLRLTTNALSGRKNTIADTAMAAISGCVVGLAFLGAGALLGAALRPAITAYADGPAGNVAASAVRTITGYTKHGIDSAISHDGVGVATRAILDAVKNPLKIVAQSGGRQLYVGQDASVVLNAAGKVITTWARNRAGWRIP